MLLLAVCLLQVRRLSKQTASALSAADGGQSSLQSPEPLLKSPPVIGLESVRCVVMKLIVRLKLPCQSDQHGNSPFQKRQLPFNRLLLSRFLGEHSRHLISSRLEIIALLFLLCGWPFNDLDAMLFDAPKHCREPAIIDVLQRARLKIQHANQDPVFLDSN